MNSINYQFPMTNFKNISDNELFSRCKKAGKVVLQARQIFGGLLPEVCKRRLYEKKGFGTIYEFAAKLAGFTNDQVDTYIRLERKYLDKPILHSALVEGKISINKLVRIASIATAENQSELFDVAQKLSKAAIDVYVKDYKADRAGETCRAGSAVEACARRACMGAACTRITCSAGDENEKQNGLFAPENAPKTLPVQSFGASTPNIDFEIIAALKPELKIKIKALLEKGINVSELFTEFLERREQEISNKKEEITANMVKKSAPRTQIESNVRHAEITQKKPVTRHIPAIVKNIIRQEFGTKCANPNCIKISQNLHHQKRFAVYKTHDPRFIEPLCKAHHELEHLDDLQYRLFRLAATG
jgi:hypothetical protein